MQRLDIGVLYPYIISMYRTFMYVTVTPCRQWRQAPIKYSIALR
jgi:hypothetical protein